MRLRIDVLVVASVVLSLFGCGGRQVEDADSTGNDRRDSSSTGSTSSTSATNPSGSTMSSASVSPTAVNTLAEPTTSSTTVPPETTLLPAKTFEPFTGIGIWVDMFEWSPTVTDGTPTFDPDDVQTLRSWGVQTVYIQSGRQRGEQDVLDPGRFKAIVDACHSNGIDVVSWYLPQHVDEERDFRRLIAATKFGIDGIVVDLESSDFADVTERNARAKRLGERLRGDVGELPIGAAVFSPVALSVHEPETWPGFDWQAVLRPYDVIFPMSYWTIYQHETPSSGDAFTYTKETLNQLRILVPDKPIHNVGGVLYEEEQFLIPEMMDGLEGQEVVGVSLYSWKNARAEHFAPLQTFSRRGE